MIWLREWTLFLSAPLKNKNQFDSYRQSWFNWIIKGFKIYYTLTEKKKHDWWVHCNSLLAFLLFPYSQRPKHSPKLTWHDSPLYLSGHWHNSTPRARFTGVTSGPAGIARCMLIGPSLHSKRYEKETCKIHNNIFSPSYSRHCL